MSTNTQIILNNYILFLLKGSSITGCQSDTSCIRVINEEVCPTVKHLSCSHLLSDSEYASSAQIKTFSEATRWEESVFYWNDTGESDIDACYKTPARQTVRSTDCVVGRPLIFEGEIQLAQLIPGRDWCQNQPAARTRSLTPRERKSVGGGGGCEEELNDER